jgi:hypothetical protein
MDLHPAVSESARVPTGVTDIKVRVAALFHCHRVVHDGNPDLAMRANDLNGDGVTIAMDHEIDARLAQPHVA